LTLKAKAKDNNTAITHFKYPDQKVYIKLFFKLRRIRIVDEQIMVLVKRAGLLLSPMKYHGAQ